MQWNKETVSPLNILYIKRPQLSDTLCRTAPEEIGSAVGHGAAVVTSIATEVGDAATDGGKTLSTDP